MRRRLRLCLSIGTRENLSADDQRLTFDDKSESHGLFKTTKADDKVLIEANRIGSLGQGILIVRVHNLYNVRVTINVVGYSSLQLTALPYPYINQPNSTLTSLRRIGGFHGNFQQAALNLSLELTDNSTFDVSTTTAASFSVVSNDVGVKASFAISAKNVLLVDSNSSNGMFRVCGRFSWRASKDLELEVSSRVLTVNRILEAQLSGLKNHTLLGPVHSTKAQIEVVFLMNDSSVVAVQNFTTFDGLVNFTTSNPQVINVSSSSGVVTLESDYYDSVTVKVTPLQGLAESKLIQFFCNTVPQVGGVDIGQEYGPALPVIKANRRITIPVRVKQGTFRLLAYDIMVSYNDKQARLVELRRSGVYSHTKGQLHIADVINPDKPSTHVADLVFDALVDGSLSIQASVNTLIDDKLGYIGNHELRPTQCTKKPLGDVNEDCIFDIQDPAYVMAFTLAQENNFADEFGQTLLKKMSTKEVSKNVLV